MNKREIELICQILKHQNHEDLMVLIAGGFGKLDDTGQYGNYWNSSISHYSIFLETKKYLEAKSLSVEDKNIIFNAILDLYPHTDSAPEVISLDFKLLKDIPEGFLEQEEVNSADIVAFEHDANIKYDFLIEQIHKAETKYLASDFDGSLTNVRSSIEAATFDIYKRITGEEIVGSGSLQDDYKKIKSLLNLAPEKKTSDAAKKMVSSLISAIDAIDEITNAMGDRHLRKVQPEPHHTAFCLNASKTVLNFLYSSLIYQYKQKDNIYNELINFFDTDYNRNLSKESLLLKTEVNFIYSRCDTFTKNLLKNKLINEFEITSFRRSDIFFAFLRLFSDTLTKKDIAIIIEKHLGNRQADGIKKFMEKHKLLIEEDEPKDEGLTLEEARDLDLI